MHYPVSPSRHTLFPSVTRSRPSDLARAIPKSAAALWACLLILLGSFPLKAETMPSTQLAAQEAPTVHLGKEWRTLLDPQLSTWELWMGIPHQSVTGLPPVTASIPDGIQGKPLGLNNDPKKVYSVIDDAGESVLHITGEIFGGLTSKESFTNYHLQLQVRWGKLIWEPKLKAPRDSGLLFHCTGQHGAAWDVWKRSVEFQVEDQHMGDLYLLSGTRADVQVGDKEQTYDPSGTFKPASFQSRRLPGAFEKPMGDWNTLDLYTIGQTSVFVLNGQMVQVVKNTTIGEKSDLPGIPLTAGQLQIQSEGAEVEYRRIKIRGIDQFPPDIAKVVN